MENTQNQRCHHCGSELTGETAGGLCPRCLLEMNFASRTMPGGEPSPQLPPPSPEEMADRFPQFEILECLGRGGMGIVYKARQKTLDRLVAIKVLAGERRDDPQFEARFSREARTLAKLSHPNIVTVHDFGESDGLFYLVMEYVDGVNLRDILQDGRMESAQALAIVPEICEALQFAHEHGVVHRDIKPENILMDRDGRVKIADFGIATLVGADADRSGTPPYMAPEQEAAEGTIDHRADIYALGVVFYEMLTGERPEQDPSRPSRRVEIDVRLDEIVLRALEKEPELRYQTAGEFRTVLETMAAADTSAAGGQGTSAAVGNKYNPWEAAIVGLGTVFFFVLISYAWELSSAPFTGICIMGLCICVLSLAGIWPFFSPFFPDPNFSSRNTRRCKALIDRSHPSAADQSRAPQGAWQRPCVDRRSKHNLFGLPLWHVATGFNPETGRPRIARGIVAIGDQAQGVIAIGGVAMGGFAFGGFSIGVVSIGGFSAGLLAIGGFGLALIAAFAGFAMAPIAHGGMAIGWYASGSKGVGAHVTSAMAKDPEAVRFFDLWSVPLMTAAGIATIAIIAFTLLLGVGLPLLKQRKSGATREASAPASQNPSGKQGRTLAALVGIIAFMVVGVITLLFWLQRPVMIDHGNRTAESPDRMYSAMGQTWREMRVLGGDRVFYRFIVQGRGGAVWEKWDVEVPSGQLASSYVALSVDEVVFDKHGLIVWSEDGRRVSFRVNEREVSAFNTEDGGHSFQDGFLPQRVVELSPAEDTGCAFLDVDSGGVFEPSEDEIRRSGPGVRMTGGMPQLIGTGILEWMRSNGADLVMRGAEKGVTLVGGTQIIAAETTGPQADSRAFDTIPPKRVIEAVNAVEKALATGPRHDPVIFSIEPGLVHAVKTREGAVALVEILKQSKEAPLRLRFKLVKPETTTRAAYFGEWKWHEGGNSGDFSILILKDDGAAVVMEDGENGETGEWAFAEEGITLTVGGNTVTGVLDPNGCLVLGTGRGAHRFTRKEAGVNVGQADIPTVPGKVAVEEAALHLLVAIREKDEAKIRALCVDRGKGWTNALVGHFSMEMRERFRQSTGEEFTLYPGESLVDGDLAVVHCVADADLQPKLKNNTLVLYFCRTESGWKNWTLRGGPVSQRLDKHLEQARKWAAEWEDAPSLPVPGAHRPVEAAPAGEAPKLRFDIFANLRSHDNIIRIRIERREQEHLVLWMDTGIKKLETKLLDLTKGTELEERTHLRIRQHARLREAAKQDDWKMAEEIYSKIADKGYVLDLRRIMDAPQQMVEDIPVADGDPVKKAKALPVTPPGTMPEGSPLTVEQVRQVLEGVTWNKFIATFADDGHEDEVTWKAATPEVGNGRRFEVTFPFGGEKMRIDIEVDREFQLATPSRLGPAKRPEQMEANPSEFLPQMAIRYAVKVNHPAAAPAMERINERVLQVKTLSTMREYAVAMAICMADTGALPPNLQMLVEKKYFRELTRIKNHETGKMELPLYHGRLDLPEKELDASKFIVLAAPSADPSGRRVVGFLDSHVDAIDEADYLKQLKAQQKPLMEQTLDSFLESCATGGVDTGKKMFEALGMAEFIEKYGSGEKAHRDHHEHLPPVMRFAIAKSTGEPSPEFVKYLRPISGADDSRHKAQALLLLRMLGIAPRDGSD